MKRKKRRKKIRVGGEFGSKERKRKSQEKKMEEIKNWR